MSRASLNSWIAELLDAGSSPGTARIRQLAVRRFASWLTAGGEIHADPFPGIKAPRCEPPLVEPLTDTELRALITTCAVPEENSLVADSLHHRRDEAIIRPMFETAIRSGEVVDLQLDDLDLVARLITVRHGKGGRGSIIPIGQTTTEALLAYLVEREEHPLADEPDLWLGSRGKRFGREGSAEPCVAEQCAPASGPPAPAHGSAPLARRRRLGIRSDVHRWLDPDRHARPLHPSPRGRSSGRGGSPSNLGDL